MFNSIIYYLLEMDMPKNKESEVESKKESEVERKERRWQNFEIISIFIALVLIACIWSIYPDTLRDIDQEKTPITVPFKQNDATNLPYDEKKSYAEKIGEKYGAYGDAYGSLNTLFSGWAFALLLISLFMQRRELQEQRKELAAQRDEITKANEIAESQRNITKQQSELLAQQSFYSLLFKLLDEKNNKINLFYFQDSFNKQVYEKYECFKFFSNYILHNLDNFNILDSTSVSPLDYKKDLKEFLLLSYLVPHSQSENLFEGNLYFEHLINILIFIEQKSHPNDIDSDIAFLKSYISHDELVCLAVLGLKDKRFYKYIEKYGLLEHFNTGLFKRQFLLFQILYEPNAFMPFTSSKAA
ncbi:putative phage abortive infection protein [Acinetobacter pittii]|uniref:putative phage abortive infection protein n=1 Tax=Acinetobacter pittii TaxID=48296 RepID=UPI00320B69D0